MRHAILLFAALLLAPALPSTASAQTAPESAAADSVKKKQDLAAEQQRLKNDMSALRQEVDGLQKQIDTGSKENRPDLSKQMRKLERKMRRIEDRIALLDEKLRSSDSTSLFVEDWDENAADDDWGFEEEWQGQDDTESDEQFTMRPNLYKKYPGSVNGLFPLDTKLMETVFRYNRIEGPYLGFAQPKRLYWHSQPKMVGIGSIGYGFANHRWRYSLGAYLPFYFEDMIVEFGGEGHSFLDSKDQWLVNREENTAMAFFAREDFMDYFSREGYTVTGAWHYKGPASLNLRGTLGYVHDSYRSVTQQAEWSMFGGEKTFRPQAPISDGNVNSIVFSAAASTTPLVSSTLSGWDAQFSLEAAGGGLKGDFDFTQIVVDIRRYQPLADYLGLNLRFRAGASDGDVPLQRSFDLGGISTLPGYRYKEFSGTHAALVNAELILRSSLIEDARGWVANVLSIFNIIAFYDAGVTNEAQHVYWYDPNSVTPTVAALYSTFDNGLSDLTSRTWKSDAGIAIGSTDGDFRIGMAWRLDHSTKPNFVLRFSRPF